MDNKEKRGFHPIYILAVLYVAAVYLFPVIFGGMSQNTTGEQDISIWPLLIPFAFGLINLFVVIGGRNRIERVQLLNCAVFIKYALIPFYIIGGLCIAVMILLPLLNGTMDLTATRTALILKKTISMQLSLQNSLRYR